MRMSVKEGPVLLCVNTSALWLQEVHRILPQISFFFFLITWKHVMRKKIYCAVCMRFISQKAEKW